jgi:hypothetical protein
VVLPETLTSFGWTDSTSILKFGLAFPPQKERPIIESLFAAGGGCSLWWQGGFKAGGVEFVVDLGHEGFNVHAGMAKEKIKALATKSALQICVLAIEPK